VLDAQDEALQVLVVAVEAGGVNRAVTRVAPHPLTAVCASMYFAV
jgi:hypothetical protein